MSKNVLTPLWERIWAKVITSDRHAGCCWTWAGALSVKRRGQKRPVIQLGRRGTKVVLVARLMCELWNGPPPDPSYEAGHTCPDGENDQCVRPSHLVWMTRFENEQYKQRRARDSQDARR